MSESILTSVKHNLGLADDYTQFDLDVTTHINAAFSVLHQLGVGPDEGVTVTDASTLWAILGLSGYQLNAVKSWTYLKVRSMFDPPSTSFAIQAMDRQIQEFEWRLNLNREFELVVPEEP